MVRSFWKRVPKLAKAFFALGLLGGILHILSRMIPEVAAVTNRYIGGAFRWLLGAVTSVFPFSVAEIALLLSPAWIALLIWQGWRCRITPKRRIRFLSMLLGVILLLYFLFVVMLGAGYGERPLSERLQLAPGEITEEKLYHTAVYLLEKVNEYSQKASYDEHGFSKAPLSLGEMSAVLRQTYGNALEEYSFLQNVPGRVKPILLSRPMTYTNISGIYSYMTGEANVNVHYPDYVVAFTAAHEMAHQRGVSREDEANFMAFLICQRAENDYLRYAGYLNALEYVLSALRKCGSERYRAVVTQAAPGVRGEWRAYAEHYQKYQGTLIGDVSESINNGYLIMNGTEGTVSYGLVVDLLVAYYAEETAR